jgi:flagellar biosynthetic protein FliO
MPEQSILNTFLILILSVLIMGGLFYALKKYIEKHKAATDSAYIKIISKQPLSAKSNLYIIETEQRRFLIGVAEKNISLISELNPKETKNNNTTGLSEKDINSSEISDLSFKNFLKSAITKS